MPMTFPNAQWRTHSAYYSARADVIRAKLFEALGPNCAECGCSLDGTPWEVNHIYRREWQPRKLSKYRRNLRYWHEAQKRLVNLLCRECNQVYRPKQNPPTRSNNLLNPF